MLPRVSVVISNYNGVTLKLVEESLQSILKNNYPNLEVLLIDNASTDDSVSVIKNKFGKNKKLKIIENPVNMYSQGLNLGIKNSTGKYVAFFNNDATVENGYFQTFIQYLEKNKKIALSQGKLLSAKNHTIIDCVGETMDKYGNPTSIGHGEKAQKKYEEEKEILSVSGSCSILRKSVVDKIGYFDQDYGIGYEDMDLSLRARMHGYSITYFPQVFVYHKRGATDLSPIVRIKVRWHFNKNRIMTIIKNFPWGIVITSLPVVIILYIAAGLWEIIIKRNPRLGLTRFTAIVWVIGHFAKIIEKRKKMKRVEKRNQAKIFSLMNQANLFQTIKQFIKP